MFDINGLKFDEQGLLPGVIQTPGGEVRMVLFFNREAIQKTQELGFVTYWCRTRKCLHTKGEASNNRLKVLELRVAKGQDALIWVVDPTSADSHPTNKSGFEGDALPQPWLEYLETLLKARKADASLEGSYTQKLFAKGIDRIAKKVVEESGEVIIAAKNYGLDPSEHNREEYLGEAADLLFHLQVLLISQDFGLQDIAKVLQERHRQRS